MGPRRALTCAAAVGAALAACTSNQAAAPPPGPSAVTLTITRDYGRASLDSARAAPGQSALTALRRNARVETSYSGRFVDAIDGLHGDRSAGWDWLYFINGIEADRGAADYTLHPGDREWWDYRYWSDLIRIPVAIGSWPDPFVHGFDGHRPRSVDVSGLACASAVAAALRADGVQVAARPSPYTIRVETFAAAADALAPATWRGRGLTVYLDHGRVMVYHGPAGTRPQPDADAVIAAYQPEATTGSAALIVAGADRSAACAAARTLAGHPDRVAATYAVALDGGRVVAAGGRP
ncbi:MAG TPA: DUF4430 domain-containing protein [Gaiellales bacterium]|jgi:hypothetical protein|nr:DUF4430 domain-containing protein [Gaiellales bacterium]